MYNSGSVKYIALQASAIYSSSRRCPVKKDLSMSILLDFYGDMLTEKQRRVFEMYYNEDLSLSEIASHSGITRQGVRDSIKRSEFQLLSYEERLGLLKRFQSIQLGLDEITSLSQKIIDCNSRYAFSADISRWATQIAAAAEKLKDEQ